MIEHGGQNPLEPARFGCKIIHGPHIDNFYEVYKLLKKIGISNEINNLNALVNLLNSSLKEKRKLHHKAKKLKNLGKSILNKTLNEINQLI